MGKTLSDSDNRFLLMAISTDYDDWSNTYDFDRNRTRDLDRTALQETFAAARFDIIVELGCGTGKNSTFLSTRAQQLLALDFSVGMLEKARKKVTIDHVSFVEADLTRKWPVESGFADLVTANLVLEHIRDLTAIFCEAAQCLKSGGLFYVSELHPVQQYAGKQAVFSRGDTVRRIPAFIHHISDYMDAASTAGLQLRNLREWWNQGDSKHAAPRLISFLFARTDDVKRNKGLFSA